MFSLIPSNTLLKGHFLYSKQIDTCCLEVFLIPLHDKKASLYIVHQTKQQQVDVLQEARNSMT